MDIKGLFLGMRFINGQRRPEAYSCLDRLGSVNDESAIETIISEARTYDIGGIFALGDARLLPVLRRLQAASAPEVYPVIPNVLGYVREAADYGMVGAGMRRVLRLGLWRLIILGLRSMPQGPALLKRNFVSMMDVLLEMEMGDFQRFRPKVVFLHGQITDLALAVGNYHIFNLFARRMRERYGVEPGLATYNFGTLVPRLQEWQIDINTFYTPFHPSGFLMYPSAETCEALCRDYSLTVISELISPDGIVDDQVFQYLHQHGIQAASIDVVQPEDMATISTYYKTQYEQRS